MTFLNDPTSRAFARLTGFFYLLIAVAGVFSIAYVPSQIVVAGDPAATLRAIAAQRGLFSLGIGGDAVVLLSEVAATALLFLMFRTVSETLALTAAMARFAMVAVMAAMLFFQIGLLALADSGVEHGLAPDIRALLAHLFLKMHHAGIWIWQLFFWLHLLLLGQLVAQSGRFPRTLGHALSIGAFGYLLDSIVGFAAPGSEALVLIRNLLLGVVSLAEIGFALWLVTVGPRHRE